ncbi:hypothetical protein RJ634_005989 [Pseudomonas aeruginosa]|nr:hypothetical protein [Pseudomonas aeruginosa]
MSDNFTKGPWRPGFKNIGHVTAENGAVIAKCERLTSLVNVQANARLMAASPELLEALRELLSVYEGTVRSAHCQVEADNETVDMARAAIAKATGQ